MSGISADASPAPFSLRGVLLLVGLGAALFVALLWMIGAGVGGRESPDGGGHALSPGLNGFAGLARLLDADGVPVRMGKGKADWQRPGLLVLTPPHSAEADDIAEALAAHRDAGPTLLVLPKWHAMAVPRQLRAATKAKSGWVMLGGGSPPPWADRLPQVGPLGARAERVAREEAEWRGPGVSGPLPAADPVQTLSEASIEPMIEDGRGQVLAGRADEDAGGAYPLIVVAEPDLLDNYGIATRSGAELALILIDEARGEETRPVMFDVSLHGIGHEANLLTLAFQPPFLAATLCLLLAAIVAGWRAFLRFAPPRREGRAIAFGKQALVTSVAALIQRARRPHLVGPPYVERSRERLARALALPHGLDAQATDTAIDRALAGRDPAAPPFSAVARRLSAASAPHEMIKAARDLHALERNLTR